MLDLVVPGNAVLALGATLVNFLWQAAAVGLVTAAVLATCPRATAATRYAIAVMGLAVMATAPAITFALVWRAPATVAGTDIAVVAYTTASVLAGAAAVAGVDAWMPSVVGVWAVVVSCLTLRLARGWWTTERVRRRDTQAAPDTLARAVHRLARSLRIARRVDVVESPWIDVPAVVGWLRPTILVPVGAFTGMSWQQIEAVISHELAHVRRHDYLVNSLQNVVETLFFFHPSVWWLSRQVRIEREHCCDDVAVSVCGSAVEYARALATLEESRPHMPLALAATDGPLVARIRRLVTTGSREPRVRSFPIAACVVVIMGALLFTSDQIAQAKAPGAADVAPAVDAYDPASRAAAATAESLDDRFVTPMRDPRDATVPTNPASRDRVTVAARRDAAATQAPDAVPPASPSQPTAPVRVGGGIREPRKTEHVAPIYPEAARAAGVQGVVILEAMIDTDGSVSGITVLRSIPDLDQAAINAVRQWRYQPTLLNGQPVAVMMTVTVNFTLTARTETTVVHQPGGAESLVTTGGPGTGRGRGASGQASGIGLSAPAPHPAGMLRVGGAIHEPRKIRSVPPIYPAAAQAAHVSGVVILEVVVDAGGNVAGTQVLRSVPMLDAAAIDAVRQWQYIPTRVNGVPTPVLMTVTVNFTLN